MLLYVLVVHCSLLLVSLPLNGYIIICSFIGKRTPRLFPAFVIIKKYCFKHLCIMCVRV